MAEHGFFKRKSRGVPPSDTLLNTLAVGNSVRWRAAEAGGVWKVTALRRSGSGGREADIVFPSTGLKMIIVAKAADAWERV